MKIQVFKSEYENRLFSLYVVLDRYFQGRKNLSNVTSVTGYYDLTTNVIPFLFQAFSAIWKRDKSIRKMVKTDTSASKSCLSSGFNCNVYEFERKDYL